MILDIFFLVCGIALLVAGGNYLTDGAVAVARRFHFSSMLIGLTVVALGSSMPDIVVCVEAAIRHKTAIALGDVVGANIFDILLVVGIMALVRPWSVSDQMRREDLPILALSSVALWAVGNTILFDGTSENVVDRSSGILLLVIFIMYMVNTIREARSGNIPSSAGGKEGNAEAAVAKPLPSARSRIISWIKIGGGLAALVLGGNWIVDGASGIALKAGMTQGMVALTVVAIGNSLPDLVTSVVATVKGEPRLAFGNIVGSCVLNILCGLGLAATVSPLYSDSIGLVDYLTLAGAAVLLSIIPAVSPKRMISRPVGMVLVASYVAYMCYVIISAN